VALCLRQRWQGLQVTVTDKEQRFLGSLSVQRMTSSLRSSIYTRGQAFSIPSGLPWSCSWPWALWHAKLGLMS